ncbi:MAG: SRPBCC domain-containing protein, partial [Balneolaceae bacterium]
PTEKDLDLMLQMGAIEGLTEIWDRLHNYLSQL